MRRLAVIIEFIIAAIDCPTVLVIGVPHFGSVPPAARSAFDFAGEDGYPAVAILPFPAPFNFFLCMGCIKVKIPIIEFNITCADFNLTPSIAHNLHRKCI